MIYSNFGGVEYFYIDTALGQPPTRAPQKKHKINLRWNCDIFMILHFV